MKIDELLKEGLLVKKQTGRTEIHGSLQIAQKFISRAEANAGIKMWDVAFLMAYTSMFHSARALLFKNGLKERSHQAMISALKELYSKNKELTGILNILNSYKVSRHAIQYDGGTCSETDGREAINDAKKFLEITEEFCKE